MFEKLLEAEKKLLEACKKGEGFNLGEERPREKATKNEIRGEFLRALILSNNQEIEEDGEKYILKIDSKGIKFSGVYISGTFDFSFCNTDLAFEFKNSVFEKEINISDSKIRFLDLTGSSIQFLIAFRLICKSDIYLSDGFYSNGEIDLMSAYLGGSLNCTNGEFVNEKGITLNCNGVKINGGVFLNENFKAKGKIDFRSSQISKSLIFLSLNEICFLDLNSSQISRLKLDNANIQDIDLDGCVYEHLDSFIFLDWIDKMPKSETFKPQPYKQLAKVLRNMGHNEDADDMMIKYNDIITGRSENWFIKKLKQIYGFTAGYGYKPMRVIFSMFTVWLFCSLFYWNTSKVAIFAPTNPLVFQKKDFYQCNVNSDGTSLLDTFSWSKYNSSNNWILNENIEGEYTTFNPFMYSLDVILPIVDLQVEKDWGQYVSSNDWTLNDFTRWLMWFEILFGWIYSLILVAILSGLAKNEKD